MSLNENWDSDVRKDMSDSLDKIVVEDKAGKGIYRHDAEGSDDMPVCCRLCMGRTAIELMGYRHILSLRLLERVFRYLLRMGNWRWGPGRGYGFWNSGMGNIGGRSWRRYRGKERDGKRIIRVRPITNAIGVYELWVRTSTCKAHR